MINIEVSPPDTALRIELKQKINQKTKPLGTLGLLEELALQISLIQQTLTPQLVKPAMMVFAGDHGIAEVGVSSFPQAVTAQMVMNFLDGGAAINVFSRQHSILLRVVDSGVNYDFGQTPHLIHAKIARGTANFLRESAMTNVQCEQALTVGYQLATKEISSGSNIIGFGEMGIGNTSSASCLMSVLCDLPMAKCVGRGTGLNDEGLAKKITVLQQALDYHHLDGRNPIQVLATFGGFEIAMMVGAMLAAAQQKVVLLIDGFIATAALLVAAKSQPAILDYCIFSHCSDEAGHKLMLSHLNAKPILNLSLRLGEGTGAALAYPIVQSAVHFLNEMASFESAGVSQKEGESRA
ncbi:MAG: nicotinate-nucleotide--dimethylbenzimidazole phosphoribosyltransferase [Methylophilaceae bacterium]